jgi:hypothetical protein
MNPHDQDRVTNDAASALASEIAAFVTHRNVSCAVAILAMAKLLGQGAVQFGGPDQAALLDAAFRHAQQEMRLRATAQQLKAAGLGALMPVGPA